MESGLLWREVAMLEHCIHPGIVPLFGVAAQVGGLVGKLQSCGCPDRQLASDPRLAFLRQHAAWAAGTADVAADRWALQVASI